jgi:glycosyltransferase involved in cell wall biosynthesis
VESAEVRLHLAPGLWEYRVPKSRRHADLELELERDAGTVVTDVAMSELYSHTPAYLDALRSAADGAHAVVACHPYTFPALRAVTNLPLWYEAQDVEATLKRHVLGSSATACRLLARVEQVERDCCRDADLIWACSTEDREELIARYGLAADRVLVVPNGLASDEVIYVSPAVRREHQRRLGIDRSFRAAFIASWHEPNVAGGRRLVEFAVDVPQVEFLILGSVGTALASEPVPPNVTLTGPVTTGFKEAVLSIADVALNPVTTGSGTNLKMLDYFGAGIPVISTAFGARGLGVQAFEHYLPAEPHQMAEALRDFQEAPDDRHDSLVQRARTYVEAEMSWDRIADALLRAIAVRRRPQLAEHRSAGVPATDEPFREQA